MPFLGDEEKADIRALHAAGYRPNVIGELFNVSEVTVGRVVTNPPSDEEMANVREALERVQRRRRSEIPSFGCYEGDKAILMREILEGSPFGPPERGTVLPSKPGEHE